jgi:hypothetical protein
LTKKQKAITMMQRPQGATGRELEKALGWLPHSVRGFLSNLGRLDKVHVRRIEKGERAACVIKAKAAK